MRRNMMKGVESGGFNFSRYNLIYPFFDTTTPPVDSSAKGNDAFSNDATFVLETAGHYSLSFNNNFVGVPFDVSLADNAARGWTLSSWCYIIGTGSFQDIVRLDPGGSGYIHRINSGTTILSLFNTNAGAQIATGGTITRNTWQLQTVTCDLDTNVIHHYIDKTKVHTGVLNGTAFNFVQNQGIGIGKFPTAASPPLPGGEPLVGKLNSPAIAPSFFTQADVDNFYDNTKSWVGL